MNPTPTLPPTFTPYDCRHSSSLLPPHHPTPSTFSPPSSSPTTPFLYAHSSLLSLYDATTLTHLSTIPTHLPSISLVSPLSPSLFCLSSSSPSHPGLHFFSPSLHLSSFLWSLPSDPRSSLSLPSSLSSHPHSPLLFSCFQCRHMENAVLLLDTSTFQLVSELGRQSGTTSRSSAFTKLHWVPSMGLLVGSAVTGGGFGYSGYVRVFDLRSGKAVWEIGETGGRDAMADVDVDVDAGFIAKVGSRTGDVGVLDMRRMGDGDRDPWVYLEESNPGLRGAGPVREGAAVHCWNEHVFVGRGGALEAWSRVNGGGGAEEGEVRWGRYRRNFMDKEGDEKKGIITKIGGGANRLFVARQNVEGVEVWESSTSSGLILVP